MAVHFGVPPRIPLSKGPERDMEVVSYRAASGFRPEKPGMDEWGCVWRSFRKQDGDQGQVVEHPLSQWERLESYLFPDPFAPGRMDGAGEVIGAAREKGRYVIGSLGPGPMHRLDYLLGFENYMIRLLTDPEGIGMLLDGIFGFLYGMVERWAGERGVDAVYLIDDQAIQTGPLFSMDLWRLHFGPRYAELCRRAHELGLSVFLHACGHLAALLPELVRSGFDVVDNKQPELWIESPSVGEVRGSLCFSTCIDIQSTVGKLRLREVQAAAERLIRRLSVPQGGFMATMYDNPDLQIPAEINREMMRAFKDFAW